MMRFDGFPLQDDPSTNDTNGGVTCGTTNSSANATLECLGGAPLWEPGYTAIYILIAVLFAICVVVSVVLIKKSKDNCFDLTQHVKYEEPLTSRIVQVVLRGFFFLFFFGVQLYQVSEYGFAVFQAYTVWNFQIQIFMLGMGLQLAINGLLDGDNRVFFGSDKYKVAIERIHLILLELTFPLSMLVCFVVW